MAAPPPPLHRTHHRLLLLITVFFIRSHESSAALLLPGAANFTTNSSAAAFWLSPNRNLTFGFKPLTTNTNSTTPIYYLPCIWMTSDAAKTALWWPSNATSVASGTTVIFTDQGELHITDAQGRILWRAPATNASLAQLQDTGNLQLLHGTSNEDIDVLWQSFSDLRDSLMVPSTAVSAGNGSQSNGGGLTDADIAAKPQLLQSRHNQSSYAAGRFRAATDNYHNLYLHAVDEVHTVDFIYVYASLQLKTDADVFKVGQDNGKTYVDDGSTTSRRLLRLEIDGNLRIYEWNRSNEWQVIWQFIDNKCLLGSPCGAFAVCSSPMNSSDNASAIRCTCPPTYAAVDPQDSSKGCYSALNFSSSPPSLCTNSTNTSVNLSYDIAVMNASDYYYNDLSSSSVSGLAQCGELCLNQCTCAAASYRISDGRCFLKGSAATGLLLNGYSTEGNDLLIKIAARTMDTTREGQQKKKANEGIIGAAVAVVVVVLMVLMAGLAWRRRESLRQRWGGGSNAADISAGTGPIRYQYQQLVAATKDFEEVLGEGGFGVVYKGTMADKATSTSVTVAVKVLKTAAAIKRRRDPRAAVGGEAEKQFQAEVGTLGKIHHVNLVQLLGYCIAGEKRILVYEYIEKGSLAEYLSTTATGIPVDRGSVNVLTASEEVAIQPLPWRTRHAITVGMARGIAYLHHDCSPPILHCDIKPQNVLLDGAFTPKLTDFGFARRLRQQVRSYLTVSGAWGTWGYMAPEWMKTDRITSKADVYGYGMVLLELVRGFHDSVAETIDWAFDCVTSSQQVGSLSAEATKMDGASPVGDGGGDGENDEERIRLLKIGLWCIQYLPESRPSMLQILQLLEGGGGIEPPPRPTWTRQQLEAYNYAKSDTSRSSELAEMSSSVVSGR